MFQNKSIRQFSPPPEIKIDIVTLKFLRAWDI